MKQRSNRVSAWNPSGKQSLSHREPDNSTSQRLHDSDLPASELPTGKGSRAWVLFLQTCEHNSSPHLQWQRTCKPDDSRYSRGTDVTSANPTNSPPLLMVVKCATQEIPCVAEEPTISVPQVVNQQEWHLGGIGYTSIEVIEDVKCYLSDTIRGSSDKIKQELSHLLLENKR